MKLDILAFGAHPDDVELSCGGTLLVEKQNGKKVGVIDLTAGELGTRGTAETRAAEATEAARLLKLDVRENLCLPDGFFENNQYNQRIIITAIRKYQPEIIFANAVEDRHPDHARGAALIRDAAFLSGLMKITTQHSGENQQPWRPKYVFHYIQDRYLKPNFVIDITTVHEQKLEAIRAYKTQFHDPDSKEPETYISTPDFLESIIYRAKMFGKMVGVKFAEGFVSEKMIGFGSLDALIKQNT
jgi:N-acetylglucosamine malate deacetylase 1